MELVEEKLLLEVKSRLNNFMGMSFEEIAFEVGINPDLISSKLSIVTLLNKMLEHVEVNKPSLVEVVKPMKFSIKTVRLEESGKPKESMSFEQVDFLKLSTEKWETSFLREKLNKTLFLFLVFQYQKQTDNSNILIFRGAKFWKMPVATLNTEVKEMWEKTKDIVNEGVKIEEVKIGKGSVIKNNLPGISDNRIVHLRPKAKDANDKVELPSGHLITKQAYWINGSYIGEILKDMPALDRKEKKKGCTYKELPIEELELLRNKLTRKAYTVQEFLEIAKQTISGFEEAHINTKNLSKIQFTIESLFILSNEVKNIDSYLDNLIFEDSYFKVPDNMIFKSGYVKRKIENFENAYKLLKVEDGIYITNKNFERDGLERATLLSYKEAVENFVNPNTFFTLTTLSNGGFEHDLEEYGFDNIFYEAILKRPGRLKFLKIANTVVFTKSKRSIDINDFISFVLEGRDVISVDSFISNVFSKCNLKINYEHAIKLMKSSNYFYSNEMERLFRDKETFYTNIYGR